MKDWLLLFLRLIAGVGLAYWAGHGKVFDEETREAYSLVLADAGIPAAYFTTLFLGVVEFFGSCFIAAGFFTRKAASLMIIAAGTSAAIQLLILEAPVAHLFLLDQDAGFGTGIFMIAYVVLLLFGPGNISFDAGRRRVSAED
ncbi:MAG: DoxX family protein [Planctomycetes bacterium]|nr:DoxX family protein [Planctomycetota bacterium]MCP4770911.1 DoxX family protein [Planctomycetota bacterium]MCP4862264.1 DoxX family protein [Planctomycetota bacterium]